MICPNCRAEYQEGVRVCADCGEPLVSALPAEPPPPTGDLDLVEVLATYNPGDVAILRSVLDANAVEYFMHNEHFAHLRPMVEPTRLLVRGEQVELVQDLLKNLRLNFGTLIVPRPEAPDAADDSEDENGTAGQP
jgi:hypothetical protein